MTPRVRLAVVAAMLLLLVLFALWPSDVASDMPVSAVPISGFEAIGDAGSHVGTRQARRPSQLRTPSPATVPAPAVAVTPSTRAVPRLASVRSSGEPQRGQSPSPAASVTGTASWFRSPAGVSAAGPVLRAALGPDWRGTVVRVTGPAGSAVVVLGDWMRRDRLIDLDAPAFIRVCGALALGLCRVIVEWP